MKIGKMKKILTEWRKYLKEEEYVPKGQRMYFPAEHLESHMGEYRTELRWKEFFKKSKEEQRAWAKTVDLTEPVEVTVFIDGTFAHGDGHHRTMAAKLLGKNIPIIITRNHIKEKADEGVWEEWLKIVQAGKKPKDLNPEQYSIKSMEVLNRDILGKNK